MTISTLAKLSKEQRSHRNQTVFLVPLKIGRILKRHGVSKNQIKELDWWEHVDLPCREQQSRSDRDANQEQDVGTATHSRRRIASDSFAPEPADLSYMTQSPTQYSPRIVAVPSQHESHRHPTDRDTKLWCGFVIIGSSHRVFFAGDSGYRFLKKGGQQTQREKEREAPRCPAFVEIGDIYGPFDMSCLPIGAFRPRWYNSVIHAAPQDAVEMFLDTRTRKALAIHCKLSAEKELACVSTVVFLNA